MRAGPLLGALLAAVLAAPASGGEGADPLLESTLPLRAALHQDATLAAPLERLVAAWREAGRLPELIQVYREHLDGWPDDAAATVVWLRLLQAAGDPAAPAAVRAAVGRFPVDAYLHYLAWLVLRDVRDKGALDELEKAVNLEVLAWRRRQWSAELVKEAAVQGRRDLALRHLQERAAAEERADALFETGRAMAAAGFAEEALTTLLAAQGRNPDPETVVAIELEAAAAESALGRREAAAVRLDALAARLGPEHWRRPEVARRRLALAVDEGERERLLAGARERLAAPASDEAAVLDAARLLAGSGHRAEALAGLRAAAQRLAGAVRLEREIDLLFDLTRDEAGRAAWLAERLAADPARTDLAWRRAEALYRSGRISEGEAAVAALLPALAPPARADALAGLGRALRKAAVADAATVCFQKALEAAPERLALRRELGECLVAIGQRRQLRELLSAPAAVASARTAPVEALLEVLPFCQRNGLVAEATALADARLAADPGQFEVLLTAARLARLAHAESSAMRRLLAARALADTPARYRAWLEGLCDGEDLSDAALAALIDGEDGRIAATESERLAALAEAALGRNQPERARALVERALIAAAPEQVPALHRTLVACLEKLPERAGELAATLARMAEEEPESRDEALIRLALLGDGTDPALAPPDLAQVRDAALLSAWYERQRTAGDLAAALAASTRLVEIEPSSPERWRTHLALLAVAGDEEGFRTTVRRILAGVDRLRPAGAVRTLLARHLADSCWRQTVRALAKDDPGAIDAALGAIAEVEAGDPTAGERAWLLWARALLAARSGRTALRDEACKALRPAAQAAGDRIELPDGVTLSLAAAEARLAAPAPQAEPALPLRPWRTAWALRHPEPVGALAATADMAVALGSSGTLAAYELAGGRMRWRIDGGGDACGMIERPGQMPLDRTAVLLVAGNAVVTASSGDLVCRDTADGRMRWRAGVGQQIDAAALDGDQIVAVEAAGGRLVAVDLASGRRRWDWTPELPTAAAMQPLVAIDGRRVLFYGRRTALLDTGTRSVLWSFDLQRVRPVDVRLDGSEAQALQLAQRVSHGCFGGGGSELPPAATAIDAQPGFPASGDHRLIAPLATMLLSGQNLSALRLFGGMAVLDSYGDSSLIPLDLPGLAMPGPAGSGNVLGLIDGQPVCASSAGIDIGDGQGRRWLAVASTMHAENDAPVEAGEAAEAEAVCAAALDGRTLYACSADGVAAFAMPAGGMLMMAPLTPLMREALDLAGMDARAHVAGVAGRLVVAFGANLVGLHAPSPDAGHAFP